MLVLLDNTVLSNFALVRRTDLLLSALGPAASTTPQVMEEFQAGVTLGRLPVTDCPWLSILTLSPAEEERLQRFLLHLNRGEAACMAVAVHRSARVLTDDRDARAFAAQRGIAISGTLGVLSRLVTLGHLTVPRADDLLRRMIDQGYRSPLESIETLSNPSRD